MFDFTCIMVSLIVAYKTKNKNRDIVFLLMAWFVVSEIFYTLVSDIWPNSTSGYIHTIYNSINMLVTFLLVKLNAHVFMLLVMAINLLLNAASTLYYEYYFVGEIVYNTFFYPAAAVSFLVLTYMITISKKGLPFGFKSSNNNIISHILCLRYVDFMRIYRRGSL